MPTTAPSPVPPGREGRLFLYRTHPGQPRRHRHSCLELNLVLRGRASYLLDGARYELTAGSLLWLFPAQDHLLVERSPDFAMWVVLASHAAVRRWCADGAPAVLRRRDPGSGFCRWLEPAQRRRLDELLAELARHATPDAEPRFAPGLRFAMLCAWEAFAAAPSRTPERPVHPAVLRAVQRLIADPTLAAPELARAAGLSRARLSRRFVADLGVTLTDYRTSLRLERFLALRDERPELTLLALALEAGFGSYAQFHRVHRRVLGRSPATVV